MITMTVQPIQTGVVTAADLYGSVEATRREIQTVLTEVRVLNNDHGRVVADVSDLQARVRILETNTPAKLAERLTSVERWQWRAGGIVAAFAVLGGVMAGLLEALIGHVH